MTDLQLSHYLDAYRKEAGVMRPVKKGLKTVMDWSFAHPRTAVGAGVAAGAAGATATGLWLGSKETKRREGLVGHGPAGDLPGKEKMLIGAGGMATAYLLYKAIKMATGQGEE